MIRTLLTRKWLGLLALATVFACVCVWLGNWQYGRYEGKSTLSHAIERNYGAEPVPLRSVLPTTSATLTPQQAWSHVQVTGRYDEAKRQFVRNRTQDSIVGYEVVWPLRLEDGTTLVVDRGFVPAGQDAAQLPPVPEAPAGEVTVVGWLKSGEQSRDRTLPSGQLASLSLDDAQAAMGGVVNRAVLVLGTEDGKPVATTTRPGQAGLVAIAPPDTDQGWINFQYGYQWWLFAVAGYGLVLFFARREWRESQGIVRAPRPKKVRIWDEEDA